MQCLNVKFYDIVLLNVCKNFIMICNLLFIKTVRIYIIRCIIKFTRTTNVRI